LLPRTVTATTPAWSYVVHARAGSEQEHWQRILEEASRLSLGVSIFLLVVGAILTFAVDVTTSGFSINTVGIILMIAGALGLVLSLLFWSSFAPYRRGRTVAGPDTVVEERRVERDLP
jgi:predicted membrane channel-forming protein YqfA (hemolysin III family)